MRYRKDISQGGREAAKAVERNPKQNIRGAPRKRKHNKERLKRNRNKSDATFLGREEEAYSDKEAAIAAYENL